MTRRGNAGMRQSGSWRIMAGRLLAGSLLATPLVAPMAADAADAPFFRRVATAPVYHNLGKDADPATETVAEIVSVTKDGMTLVYTDSEAERIGFFDIADPEAPRPAGFVALGGEPTSVTVAGGHALAGVNTSESYVEPSGHVAVISLADKTIAARCDVGGQPDSVAVSPDGAFLAVAIENERDEDLNDGAIPQMPAGHLAILDLDGDGVPTNCDAARIVDLAGLAEVAPDDPEPEFVDINGDNLAVVTLQENNHIALVDLATGEVVRHFSAGTSDLAAIDVEKDGVIRGTGSLEGVRREPDAVAWIDDERFVTADEGDYEGGSRGFTVFAADGTELWSAGNAIEHLAMRIGHFPEKRAGKKGSEPEGAETARFGDETLIFINAERANFTAVYRDMGKDEAPAFVQVLPTAVGPEGVIAIPSRDLLVVASEVDSEEDGLRSVLSIYRRDAAGNSYPQIVSDDDPATGAPIGWGALSGLAGDPVDAGKAYAVSDSFYASARIYTLDVASRPARITGFVELKKDGVAVPYDLEGIAVRPGGGFWLASEGKAAHEAPTRQKNTLLKVAADGTVEAEIFLPEALRAQATNSGFEGVAAFGEGDAERVILPVQKTWKDDAKSTTKLAVYSPADDSWGFVTYELEAPRSARGGWVGLSEITHLGEGRFALIERDNQQGDYAVIKTLTTISLDGVEPAPYGETLPVIEKTVAADLLEPMLASRGWVSDKPEGIALLADGRVLMVSDNDGVDDANGETQLIDLGMADMLFGAK